MVFNIFWLVDVFYDCLTVQFKPITELYNVQIPL
jgi:hypothetical protein